MLVSEKYRFIGDENNVCVEELKEISSKDKDTKEIVTRQEWKAVGYCRDIKYALNFIVTRETNIVLNSEVDEILSKYQELIQELEKIPMKILQRAEVEVVEAKPKKKRDAKDVSEIEDWERDMIRTESDDEMELY